MTTDLGAEIEKLGYSIESHQDLGLESFNKKVDELTERARNGYIKSFMIIPEHNTYKTDQGYVTYSFFIKEK